MDADVTDWVASPCPVPNSRELPWITTLDCVHRFNALYSKEYPAPRTAIPISDYLTTADEIERARVSDIVNWQPPALGD